MATPPTIAVVSPGEMGHAIGHVLASRGARVISPLAGRSRRTVELARAAGIEDVGQLTAAVAAADVLLSVLPSAAAPGLAEAVADLAPGRSRPLVFVECNALAPQTARAIGERLTAAGVTVVDVGIVGSPPTLERGPRLFASGPAVASAALLAEYGLDIRPIGPAIGQASGLKMCYAALTKGLSALGTELLLTAARLDLLDPLLTELESSQPVQLGWLAAAVPGMPSKARRWVSEMEEIAATFEHVGLAPGYHQAAAELFRWVGDTPLAQIPPEARDRQVGLRSVIDALAAGQSVAARS